MGTINTNKKLIENNYSENLGVPFVERDNLESSNKLINTNEKIIIIYYQNEINVLQTYHLLKTSMFLWKTLVFRTAIYALIKNQKNKTENLFLAGRKIFSPSYP